MHEPKIYLKILVNLLLFITGVLLLMFVLPGVLKFFMPFVIGWIVAMIANPLVKFLERRVKLLRKHSSAIIIIVVILAIVGILYLIISSIINEGIDLWNNFPSIVDDLEKQFEELKQRLGTISESLPNNLQNSINKIILHLGDYLNNYVSKMNPPTLTWAGNFVKNLAEGFLMTIITILSAYFFIAKRDEIDNGIKKIMPKTVTNSWSLVTSSFKTAIGGYFKAQFKIMLIIAVIIFAGLEIAGVKYSVLIALFIAFLDFLPFFGTGAVFWPWALIDMISANYVRAIILMVIYLICQIVKQILQPKMVGDSIGISPLATLIYMFIGYRFYGVLGMIIGIPIGMVINNLYRIGMFDRIIRGLKIIAHDINEFRKY